MQKKITLILVSLFILSSCSNVKYSQNKSQNMGFSSINENQEIGNRLSELKVSGNSYMKVDELTEGLEINDYVSIQYVEANEIYYIVTGPITDGPREVLLCKYDINEKRPTILKRMIEKDLYVSSFVYVDDTLVYCKVSTIYDGIHKVSEYKIIMENDEGQLELDSGTIYNYLLESSAKLQKINNNIYYATIDQTIIDEEAGNGTLGYKFMKISGNEIEELRSYSTPIQDFEYESSKERYLSTIYSGDYIAVRTWTDTKSFLYVYNDKTEKLKTIELDGYFHFMGFINEKVIYAEVFDGMQYYGSRLPYMSYDLNTDEIKEIGTDIFQYMSQLSEDKIFSFDEGDSLSVITLNKSGNMKESIIMFEDGSHPGGFSGRGYPIDENTFLIIFTKDIYLCHIK